MLIETYDFESNKISYRTPSEIASSSGIVESNSLEKQSRTSYNYLGNIVLYRKSDLAKKTMRVAHCYNYIGVTSYTVQTYNGQLASFISDVAFSLAVPVAFAVNIVAGVIVSGVGYIVGEVISVTSSVSVACDVYRSKFHSYDKSDSSTYNFYGDLGYMYVARDVLNTNYQGIYYDGVTKQSLCSGDKISYDTLIYNTYGEQGTIDVAASTVFN